MFTRHTNVCGPIVRPALRPQAWSLIEETRISDGDPVFFDQALSTF